MPKKLKIKTLGVRVDDELNTRLTQYVEQSDKIENVGELVRRAVKEYMDAHPLNEKPTREEVLAVVNAPGRTLPHGY